MEQQKNALREEIASANDQMIQGLCVIVLMEKILRVTIIVLLACAGISLYSGFLSFLASQEAIQRGEWPVQDHFDLTLAFMAPAVILCIILTHISQNKEPEPPVQTENNNQD